MTLDAHRIEPLRPYRVTGTPEPENSMALRSYNGPGLNTQVPAVFPYHDSAMTEWKEPFLATLK
jgi:hypothetical protein